jgi:hypothetical protein
MKPVATIIEENYRLQEAVGTLHNWSEYAHEPPLIRKVPMLLDTSLPVGTVLVTQAAALAAQERAVRAALEYAVQPLPLIAFGSADVERVLAQLEGEKT